MNTRRAGKVTYRQMLVIRSSEYAFVIENG
jgi:hypothetical protein